MRSFKPVIGNLPWLIDHENDPRVNIIRADTSPHPITGKTTRRFEYVFDLFYEPAPLNGVAQEPIEERVTMVLSETHGTSNHAFAPWVMSLSVYANEALHPERTNSRALQSALATGGVVLVGFYRRAGEPKDRNPEWPPVRTWSEVDLRGFRENWLWVQECVSRR